MVIYFFLISVYNTLTIHLKNGIFFKFYYNFTFVNSVLHHKRKDFTNQIDYLSLKKTVNAIERKLKMTSDHKMTNNQNE